MTTTLNELGLQFKNNPTEREYTELYKAMERPLLIFINKFIKDKEIAQDIFQSAAVKIYQKIEQFNPEFKFTTWIYTIAKYESFMYLNRAEQKNKVRYRDNNKVINEMIESVGDDALINYELEDYRINDVTADLSNKTIEAIYGIKNKWGDPLILKYLFNLSDEQTGNILGLTINQVKSRAYRGKKYVKKYLLNNYNIMIQDSDGR